MIRISFTDLGLRRELGRLLAILDDPSPMLGEIGEALVETTKRRFATSTAPSGARWEELSETTLMRYLEERAGRLSQRQTRTGGRTLTRLGMRDLISRRPLVGESKRLSREIAYVLMPNAVEVGSSLEYSGTHQFGAAARSFTGGKTPWGDIPARPFLGLSSQDRETIRDILAEYLDVGSR